MKERIKRRDYLKYAAAGSAITALADPIGAQETTTRTQEWPDFSGQRMLFLTTETGSQAQEVIGRAAQDFKEATNADVQVEYLGFDEQDQRVSQLVQAGNPPEVNSASGGELQLYGTDALAELDSVVEAFQNHYGELPGEQRQQVDDNDYHAPLWLNSDMYWYREDIVEDPVPNTWENVLTAAENADGQQGLRGTFVANGQSVCIDYNMLSWVYTNGGRSVKWQDDTVVSAIADDNNRQKWIEALNQVKELHQFSPQAADAGCSQQVNAIPNRISATSPYYGARPKIQAVERGREFADQVRASVFPQKEEQTVHGSTEGWMVFKNSNAEVGKTFLRFMYQPEYFIPFLFISPLHNVPPADALNHPQYQERLDNELSDAWTEQDIQTTVERAQDIQTPISETEPDNTVGRFLVENRLFATMRFEAIVRERDPAAVVDEFDQEAQSILEDIQD